MEFVDFLAFCGAVLVVGISTPQFLLVVRTKDTHGLSVTAWVIGFATGFAWLNHGIKLSEINLIWPNFWSLIVAFTIMYLLKRNGAYRSLVTLLPGFALAATLICIDYFIGSAAYGFTVVVPQAFGMIRQGVELMRAPEVQGVSTTAWVLQVLTQIVWFTWGILTTEYGILVASSISFFAASFVLLWRILRLRGLGPIGTKKNPAGTVPNDADTAPNDADTELNNDGVQDTDSVSDLADVSTEQL